MANRLPCTLFITAIAAALLPGMASAAGSRAGVQPEPGEMVLIRNVSARPAYRPAPPGLALLVDPKPNRELNHALGTGEMSDADFAAISSGHRLGPAGPTHAVDGAVNGALAAGLGTGGVRQGGALHGDGFGGATSGPLGTVGNTTRGIGNHVTGALSQLPFGQKPGGGP